MGAEPDSGPCFLILSRAERDLQPHREPLFVAAVSVLLGLLFWGLGLGEVGSHVKCELLSRQAATC